MKQFEDVFGPNSALVEDLYLQYQSNPEAVPPHWRDYFNELLGKPSPKPTPEEKPATPKAKVTATSLETDEKPAPAPSAKKENAVYTKLKGISSKIADNMEVSLEVPTATSLRVIPVKMLWEDRILINQHMEDKGLPKVTFTHLISWAIIRALSHYPSLNCYFERRDGDSHKVNPGQVNFGVAIDLPGKDGGRNLVVPNIKAVDKMTFKQFLAAFDDLISRARKGKLEVPDYEGTSVSITNPGTLGTVSSMPRLMKGQGSIIATGAMNYPAEFQAMSQDILNQLGISKVMAMTCTYDHRIIQGAESGEFLSKVHALLNGEEDFYDGIFSDLEIPYKPLPYGLDINTGLFNGASGEVNRKAIAVIQLIYTYRSKGHLQADINPLRRDPVHNMELELANYGLSMWDLDRTFYCAGLGGKEKATLRDIMQILRNTYCGKIGVEYMHVQETEERHWLRERMESTQNNPKLSKDEKRTILRKLNRASAFEEFLHKKFVGQKRFSLEGADSLIPMLHHMLEEGGNEGLREVVLGMAHRGRLNVLVNTMGKSYKKVFAEFEGNIDPSNFHGSGDVKYHLGSVGSHTTASGQTVRLQLLPNPSHLEAVNPVAEGAARARQDLLVMGEDVGVVLPLLIHGDAAFAGQGVVPETLNMSQLEGYSTGGTIHVIINNQIGFTTLPRDGRSTMYASDVAKMIEAPIFHVNGDEPEAAILAMRLALEYRQKFGKDAVIDLVCYRKHGHNEGDEPAFTQPGLYKEINSHPSVREIYGHELIRKKELSQQEVDTIIKEFDDILEEAFNEAKSAPAFEVKEEHMHRPDTLQKNRDTSIDTSYPADKLQDIALKLNTMPTHFDTNPKLLRILAKRHEIVANNEKKIEWGFAEALALGSLVLDGIDVRLSGQDCERGTFSHRHSVLHGTESLERHIPLNHIAESQGRYMVHNSFLSEYAVLGFEFGYSATRPDAMVIWEAQFGDFSNGAQIIIDQFISSAEAKWGQKSAVVMLLPHGYEGQGPEHSSARLERYLQLCAEDNMQVVNVTTPAQYFHLLRRQALQDKKKPLIVMSPKSLLRHPMAVSSTQDLASGQFRPLIGDESATDPSVIERVVFCSGKVYYDLLKHQQEHEVRNVAVVRIEQIYPFPDQDVIDTLKYFNHAKSVIWCQEEPKNMGAWSFVAPRIFSELQPGQHLHFVGRAASASPATGSAKVHAVEQERLVSHSLTVG